MLKYKNFLILLIFLSYTTLLEAVEYKWSVADLLRMWWEDGVLINVEETKEGKLKFVTGSILINAPVGKVWNILTDPDGLKSPYLVSTKVIQKSKNKITKEEVNKVKLLSLEVTVKITIEFVFNKSKYRIDYKMIKGDYAKSYGFLELKPFGKNKTLAFYGNYVDVSSIPLRKSVIKLDPAVRSKYGSCWCTHNT